MLCDIVCVCDEFRLDGNNIWNKVNTWSERVTTLSINSMIQGSNYFVQYGGKFSVNYTKHREFGLVPSNILVTSICGSIRKIYRFNYSNAYYES